MKNLMARMKNKGEVAFEYVVILVIVGVVMVVSFNLLGKSLKNSINDSTTAITTAQNCAIQGLEYDPTGGADGATFCK